MYKLDKYQIIGLILLGLNVVTLLIMPYKFNIETGEAINGYESLMNWVVLIYLARLVAHMFGINVYNLNGNVIGISILAIGNFYFKLFMGKNPALEVSYFGVISCTVSFGMLIGLLYLDRLTYYTGEESGYLKEK